VNIALPATGKPPGQAAILTESTGGRPSRSAVLPSCLKLMRKDRLI